MLLEFMCNLFNHNIMNAKIMKLSRYMKVIFETSPTRLRYAELATHGSLPLFLILLK